MSRFNAAEREIYRRLADHILPGYGRLPPASAIAASEAGLDEVAHVRSDLAAEIMRGLRLAADLEPEVAIRRLQGEDASAWSAIRIAVLSSYYAHDEIKAIIGYPGTRADTNYQRRDAEESFVGIDRVIARGPIWRRTN